MDRTARSVSPIQAPIAIELPASPPPQEPPRKIQLVQRLAISFPIVRSAASENCGSVESLWENTVKIDTQPPILTVPLVGPQIVYTEGEGEVVHWRSVHIDEATAPIPSYFNASLVLRVDTSGGEKDYDDRLVLQGADEVVVISKVGNVHKVLVDGAIVAEVVSKGKLHIPEHA